MIWGVVVLDYIICYVIEQYYGYAMYYGMAVFLLSAINPTVVYVIARVSGWLLSGQSNPGVVD
jgi:hypothetical protein